MSREAAEAIKVSLQRLDIRTFPRQDVKTAIATDRESVAQLQDIRDYSPLLLLPFLRTMHHCIHVTSPHHQEWWLPLNTKIMELEERCDKAKHEERIAECDMEELLQRESKDLDAASLFDFLQLHYEKFLSANRWTAARNPTDKKTPAPTFGAADVNAMVAPKFTQADVMALVENLTSMRSGGKPDRGQLVCFQCGKPGHFKRDCPDLPAHQRPSRPSHGRGGSGDNRRLAGNRGNAGGRGVRGGRHGNRSSGSGRPSWRRTPPPSDGPNQKQVDGKTWYWCGICNKWTLSHLTEGHTGRPNGAAAHVNLAIIEDPSAWHVSFANTWHEAISEFALEYFWPLAFASLFGALASHLPWLFLRACAWWFGFANWNGIAMLLPLCLYVAVVCGTLWVTPRLADPPDIEPPDVPPSFRRKQRRMWQRRNLRRRRKKGASIKDYGFHKSYPLHLRNSRTFYQRPPTPTEQTLLSGLKAWFSKPQQRRSPFKRSSHRRHHQHTRSTHPSAVKRKGGEHWRNKTDCCCGHFPHQAKCCPRRKGVNSHTHHNTKSKEASTHRPPRLCKHGVINGCWRCGPARDHTRKGAMWDGGCSMALHSHKKNFRRKSKPKTLFVTKQGTRNWKTTPPPIGSSCSMFVNGEKWTWCNHCGRWTLSHRTETHAHKVHTPRRKTKATQTSTPIALSPFTTTNDGDVHMCFSPQTMDYPLSMRKTHDMGYESDDSTTRVKQELAKSRRMVHHNERSPDQNFEHQPSKCWSPEGSKCKHPVDCPFAKSQCVSPLKPRKLFQEQKQNSPNFCLDEPVASWSYLNDATLFENQVGSLLPTQRELDEAPAGVGYDKEVACCIACHDQFITQVLQSPTQMRGAMEPSATFGVMWDSASAKGFQPSSQIEPAGSFDVL